MKAQVLYKAGEAFVLEDRPDPVPGPGEAVIEGEDKCTRAGRI